MQTWQLQEAKARFSELIRQAQNEPIAISVRGEEEAVIISKRHFNQLCKPKVSLGELLDRSPLKGLDIPFERDRSFPREIDL